MSKQLKLLSVGVQGNINTYSNGKLTPVLIKDNYKIIQVPIPKEGFNEFIDDLQKPDKFYVEYFVYSILHILSNASFYEFEEIVSMYDKAEAKYDQDLIVSDFDENSEEIRSNQLMITLAQILAKVGKYINLKLIYSVSNDEEEYDQILYLNMNGFNKLSCENADHIKTIEDFDADEESKVSSLDKQTQILSSRYNIEFLDQIDLKYSDKFNVSLVNNYLFINPEDACCYMDISFDVVQFNLDVQNGNIKGTFISDWLSELHSEFEAYENMLRHK